MNCPNCNKQVEPDWQSCPFCQTELIAQADAVETDNPYSAPASPTDQPVQGAANTEGDATGGVIPYKNPKALIAYYLGIASGLPLIGLPFGIAAFVLGILGLRARKQNPAIKGSAHAWVGIGCGGIFVLLWGALIVTLIVGTIFST